MRPIVLFPALFVWVGVFGPSDLHAQALVDTTFSWRGYAVTSTCRVRIYRTPPDDERTHTVVIAEQAGNPGPSTLSDVTHVVELIGRQFTIDPCTANWVFHWGAFSFSGADSSHRKELFIRATFHRNKSGTLSAPSWRLIQRAEVEELTDRLFR